MTTARRTTQPVAIRLPGLIAALCAVITVGVATTAHAQYSSLPLVETFNYPDDTDLDGQNGWTIYAGGVPHGILPDEYHGWLGRPDGSATAQGGEGKIDGVTLENWFGDYTGNPGDPELGGSYDKETVVSMVFDYTPPAVLPGPREPTTWSKAGNMFTDTRWHYENRGSYYKMMTTVRWFVRTNGLVSAYNGHRIKHLNHTPITDTTRIQVDVDYTNQVWNLIVGEQQVVTNFALFKTHAATDMSHDDWFKDYDGLKRIRLVDAAASNLTCTTVDNLNVDLTENIAPLVMFSPGSAVMQEADTNYTFSVQLSREFADPVIVDLTLGGTAADGVDFSYGGAMQLTFAPGETSKDIDLTILDDIEDEEAETIIFGFGTVTNCVISSPTTFTLTIPPNDYELIPFYEPFEIRTLGDLDGQHGWDSYNAVVQDTLVYAGTQAGALTGQNAYMQHPSGGSLPMVWTDVRMQVAQSQTTPMLEPETVAHLFVSTNNQVMVFDGATAVPSGMTALEGQWVRFSTFLDYVASEWELYVDGAFAGRYAFYNGSATGFSSVKARGDGTTIDDVAVTLENPLQPAPFVSFETAAASGEEHIDPVITLTLGMPHAYTVRVDYVALPTGTAISPDDYSSTTGTVTFAPGEKSATFSLNIVDDATFEGDETIELGLANFVECAPDGITNFTYTINDTGDTVPSVSFSPSYDEASESVSVGTATLVLSHLYSDTVVVDHQLAGGSATPGVDFSYSAGSVTFAPGETNKSFTFTILDDSEDDPYETIIFSMGTISNGTAGFPNTFTYTIGPDPSDWNTLPFYEPFDPLAYGDLDGQHGWDAYSAAAQSTVAYAGIKGGAITNHGGYMRQTFGNGPERVWTDIQMQVVQSEMTPTPSAETVAHLFVSTNDQVMVFDGAAAIPSGVTALEGEWVRFSAFLDYVASEWELYKDGAFVGRYAFHNVGASVFSNCTARGEGTYVDDVRVGLDNPLQPVPYVAFASASASGEENVDPFITLELNMPHTSTATVDYVALPAGTALSPDDYSSATGTVTFVPGQKSATFFLNIVDDSIWEVGGETIELGLANFTECAPDGITNFTYTITDDGDTPPTISFATNIASGAEEVAAVNATVLLGKVWIDQVTADHSLAVVGGTATLGVDYDYTPGTLTFVPGDTEEAFSLTILDDIEFEGDETIIFELTNLSNCLAGAHMTFTYTIADDNDTPPTVSFLPTAATVSEGIGTATGTVVLSHAYVGTVTVDHALALPSGSATPGDDFVYSGGSLTFNPGETSKDFTFTVVDDTEEEGPETILFTIAAVSNGYMGVESNFTCTIASDVTDVPPTVGFSPISATVAEGVATGTATVVLSHQYVGTVTVDHALATAAGTATPGDDYVYGGGQLTFNPGETSKDFTFTVIDDIEEEGPETIVFELVSVSNGVIGVESNFTCTIDADGSDVPPTVSFSPVSNSVPESVGSGTATLVLSHLYSGTVTVDHALAPASGSATPGDDYVYGGGTVTFNSGETSKDFTFTVVDDTEEEDAETIVFMLVSASNGVVGVESNFTCTIEADPLDVPPTVSFLSAAVSQPETVTNGAVAIVLSSPYSGTVVVEHQLVSTGGTATAGEDFVYSAGSVTFAPGETSKDLSFLVVDDFVEEPAETILFELVTASNAVVGLPDTCTYTIEYDITDWDALPFFEPFEERTLGALDGQYGWNAYGAQVQDAVTFGGSAKAGSITNDGGTMTHAFADGRTQVWADMRAQVVYSVATPTPDADATMFVYVATNGQVMAFDGAAPVSTGQAVAEGEWVRFTMFGDYDALTWQLYVNSVNVGTFAFFDATATSLTEFSVKGNVGVYIDDIAITTEMPALLQPPTLIILR